MKLSFDEIENHSQFEDLVVSYFEQLKNDTTNNISDICIKPSGLGTDGGRDILVTLRVNDGLVTFDRIWVIQCKFHNKSISTEAINDVNIPTLIHSYNGIGYLLVCKKKPTSKLTNFFESLEQNCRFNYKYTCWYGDPF
jgi:predicted helicase